MMLNAFYVIYTSSNENLEQHKRIGFLSQMANASLITHTDVAEIEFWNLACVFIYTLTLCIRVAKVILCQTTHFHRIACPFLAQHWVMDQNQMCLLIWFIIYLLFIINMFLKGYLVCFETCKGWIGCIFVWVIMFSFDMLHIKMILYEQNVTPRLSLIDRNNAEQNYQ